MRRLELSLKSVPNQGGGVDAGRASQFAFLRSCFGATHRDRYPRDEESAHLTESHLQSLLQGILTKTAATNVHLLAHIRAPARAVAS
jgi:hypothetical protein